MFLKDRINELKNITKYDNSCSYNKIKDKFYEISKIIKNEDSEHLEIKVKRYLFKTDRQYFIIKKLFQKLIGIYLKHEDICCIVKHDYMYSYILWYYSEDFEADHIIYNNNYESMLRDDISDLESDNV